MQGPNHWTTREFPLFFCLPFLIRLLENFKSHMQLAFVAYIVNLLTRVDLVNARLYHSVSLPLTTTQTFGGDQASKALYRA